MTFDSLASSDSIQKTVAALTTAGSIAVVVNSKSEALDKIKELIPVGASVMNGASVSLEEIGFVDYLKEDKHGWNNLHAGIVAEPDPKNQAHLRKLATISDYYLGSVHALTESGEMIIASNTGSQLPNVVYGSANLIFVVGAQKIVPTEKDGFDRLNSYVVPLEDKHMQSKYGVGTKINKVVLFRGESPFTGRKVHVIIVGEKLGF